MSYPFEKSQSQISIITGSNNDWDQVSQATDLFKSLNISSDKIETGVASAHRIPEIMHAVIEANNKKTFPSLIIAAAGGSAHLQGTVSSQTIKPVIGITIKGSVMNGVDAFLSQVRMPGGAPLSIACGNGHQSAKNSALAALSYLGAKDEYYKLKLADFYKTETQKNNENKINIYAKKYLKELENQLNEFAYQSFELVKNFDELLNNSSVSIVELCGTDEIKTFENWLHSNQPKHLNPILIYTCELNDSDMINFHNQFLNNFDTHATLIAFEKAGATNAALMALRIIGNGEENLSAKLNTFAKTQSQKILDASAEFRY